MTRLITALTLEAMVACADVVCASLERPLTFTAKIHRNFSDAMLAARRRNAQHEYQRRCDVFRRFWEMRVAEAAA